MYAKKLKRTSLCLLIFIFICSMSISVFAVDGVTPPKSYPYGLSSTAEDPVKARQMLMTEWVKWKDSFISKSGSKRVLFDDGVSTVSTGMGYGLLLSVYFNEKSLFDELFAYVKSCLDDKGLMNWKTENGQVKGQNSTTDADQNIALALIFADKMWGSGGIVDYGTEAKQLLSKIFQYDISGGQVKLGDSLADPRNPSCLAPASYEIFAAFDRSVNWGSVKTNAYSLIKKVQHKTTGLVPNWCDLNGQSQIFSAAPADEFGYESTDFPLNMAIAYSWYGHGDAKTICTKPVTFFKNIGAANIVDGYKLDGTPTSNHHGDTFVAAAAAGFMTGTDQATAKGFYNECIATTSSNYYGSTLRLFTLMYMSGYLQNLYKGGAQIVAGGSVGAGDAAIIDNGGIELTLRAKGELGAVKLEWNSIKGAQGYVIYKSTTSGGQSEVPETDFWINGNTYKDTKVLPGAQYYYFVKSVAADQSLGKASNEVVASPLIKAQGVQPQITPLRQVEKSGTVVLTIGNALMNVNGKSMTIDARKEITPVITEGRTFVPVTAIVGEMGGRVIWNSKEQKMTINIFETTVELWVGKTIISVNGIFKTMDAAPYLGKASVPMLPLRFVMESLGCKLVWDNGKTQMVTIGYNFN